MQRVLKYCDRHDDRGTPAEAEQIFPQRSCADPIDEKSEAYGASDKQTCVYGSHGRRG